MAQVDFSNAVLDVDSACTYYPMAQADYLTLTAFTTSLWDASNNQITTNSSRTIILDTPSKVSILYTGSFTASGTAFWIARGLTDTPIFKVSNISFSSGDTYSFVIDIEVSGNT